MTNKRRRFNKAAIKKYILPFLGVVIFVGIVLAAAFTNLFSSQFTATLADVANDATDSIGKKIVPPPVLDKEDYDSRMLYLAHYVPPVVATSTASSTASTTASTSTTPVKPKPAPLWPAALSKDIYPNYGAILPFKRVVAYYGNFYSKGMGVLGQYPEEEVLQKLKSEVDAWTASDPKTPAIPAIHYIAVTAQSSAGKDGKYRLRMPDDQIQHALDMAAKIDGIVFLDIQVALSDLQTELPLIEHFLKLPQVHLGIDPEFSMKTGVRPGRVIGTMDATDINFAINYLSKIVKENNLPPKILVVHRFTEDMVTNYRAIKPTPEVQVVIDMDGWGFGAKKINTYNTVINPEPVQFTGFKLFYKNDMLPPSTRLLTNEEILELTPSPIYIQYQ